MLLDTFTDLYEMFVIHQVPRILGELKPVPVVPKAFHQECRCTLDHLSPMSGT
jgi:hypothetical protein